MDGRLRVRSLQIEQRLEVVEQRIFKPLDVASVLDCGSTHLNVVDEPFSKAFAGGWTGLNRLAAPTPLQMQPPIKKCGKTHAHSRESSFPPQVRARDTTAECFFAFIRDADIEEGPLCHNMPGV